MGANPNYIDAVRKRIVEIEVLIRDEMGALKEFTPDEGSEYGDK